MCRGLEKTHRATRKKLRGSELKLRGSEKIFGGSEFKLGGSENFFGGLWNGGGAFRSSFPLLPVGNFMGRSESGVRQSGIRLSEGSEGAAGSVLKGF